MTSVYGLDGLGIEFWGGGARFLAPFETGTEAHPVSWKIVYRFSFLEVWWHGLSVDHPLRSSVKVKERVEVYLYSQSFFKTSCKETFTSFFCLSCRSNTRVLNIFCAMDLFENLVKSRDPFSEKCI